MYPVSSLEHLPSVKRVLLQRLGVEDEFVDRSTPYNDGPSTADLVEIGTGRSAVEEVVISPGQQHFVGIFEFGICFDQSLMILLRRGGGRDGA